MKKFTSFMLMLLCAVTTWAEATDLPTLTTDTGNPVWYLIKNVRKSKYATYAGDAATMTQQATANSASFFYFTGSIADGVATVKIHNYEAGDKLCAAYNSWTTEGIDWYIKAQTTGISICTSTDEWDAWNDAGGNGKKVEYWSASDAGSAWELELVTDFSSVINVEAAKTAAKTEISNHATVSGIYTIATTEYDAKIDAVEAASTGLSDLNAAVEEINSIVAEYKTDCYKTLSGKYFSIKTPARTNGYLEMSTSKVIGVSTLASPADIWQFVENNGKINIFNPYTNKYLCEPAGNSAEVAVTTEQSAAGAYDLVVNASATDADAKIKLTSNGKSAHMDGNSKLVRWDDGAASEYTVLEMSETEINSIVETHKTAAITTLTEWSNLTVVFDATLIGIAKTDIENITTTGFAAFAEIDSKLTDVTNAVAAKMFTFQTTATDANRNGVWVSANVTTSKAIGADTQDYNAIWSLRYAGGTSFYLFNELNQVYMGAPSGECTLTATPVAAYTFEIIDATQNIVEMKCGSETMHASNWASNALINYDGNEDASRWYINTIDIAADIQEILDTITESDYADVPALGQYSTAAYNALVEARTNATTVEEVEVAIATFKASKNVPVYFITSASTDYSAGSAIYYDGAWKWKTANKYDKQMWMTIPTYTEENIPTVNAYDANGTSYEICDYLTGTVMRGKSVQIVAIDGWDGAYNLQYNADAESTDAAQHAAQGGSLVNWIPATTEGNFASAWYVEYIGNSYDIAQLTDDQITALVALQTAYDAKAYYADMVEGTGIGQYAEVDEDAINSALTTAEEILNTPLTEQAKIAVENITTATNALNTLVAPTQNMPAEGKYYRIKGACEAELKGYYITSNTNADGGRIACAENADASTIYLYTDGKLVAYKSGRYIALSSSYWTFGYESAASAIEFGASTHVAGAYSIKSKDRFLHYTVYNGTVEVNRCSEYENDTNHDWYLEEVTTLPVTISEAGYATFYAPVEVTYNGIEAYYTNGEIADEKYLQLVDFEGTIPAGEGAILKGEAGDYELTISASGASVEGNKFVGSKMTKLVTKDAGNAYYILGKDSEGNVGFYNPTNGESTEEFYNAGHKAYLVITGAAQTAGYSLGFDWGGTTGIENIEDAVEENAAKAIYDITGRQIKAITVPGIYIINGKKTFVK